MARTTILLPAASAPLASVAPSLLALVAATVAVHLAAPIAAPPSAQIVKVKADLPQPLAPAGYTIRRALTLDGPLRHGDWFWNESDAPASGPLLIAIDIEAQTLSIFRGGYEIGTAVILYGDGDKPTPLGRFSVTQKDADHLSNIYDAPMPYMLRLTNDGISIHGSATIRPDYATNGCVGVPVAFAKKLFATVALGTPVVITEGRTLRIGQTVPDA